MIGCIQRPDGRGQIQQVIPGFNIHAQEFNPNDYEPFLTVPPVSPSISSSSSRSSLSQLSDIAEQERQRHAVEILHQHLYPLNATTDPQSNPYSVPTFTQEDGGMRFRTIGHATTCQIANKCGECLRMQTSVCHECYFCRLRICTICATERNIMNTMSRFSQGLCHLCSDCDALMTTMVMSDRVTLDFRDVTQNRHPEPHES